MWSFSSLSPDGSSLIKERTWASASAMLQSTEMSCLQYFETCCVLRIKIRARWNQPTAELEQWRDCYDAQDQIESDAYRLETQKISRRHPTIGVCRRSNPSTFTCRQSRLAKSEDGRPYPRLSELCKICSRLDLRRPIGCYGNFVHQQQPGKDFALPSASCAVWIR